MSKKVSASLSEARCEHCGNAVVASGPNAKSVADAAMRHQAKKHPKKKAKA